MQVANGEMPYGQFKRDFIDAGKEAEAEAMRIVDSMDGNGGVPVASSAPDLNVKHMVEIEEVPLPFLSCSAHTLLSWPPARMESRISEWCLL